MGTVAHRHRLRRRGSAPASTPISQLNRSAAAVEPSSRSESPAAAPALEWPGKETRREAEGGMIERLEVLLPRLPDVGRALIKCDGAHHRCSLPICAVCARAYRQGPIAQLHALANAYAGPHEVATIYLGLFPPGSLADADVPRAREMFRKRLDRAGFKGAIVVGGIEVAWQENWQRWLLHAQVLAIGVDANAWEQLEAALEDSGTANPVEHRPAARPRRAALLLHQVRDLSSTRTPPRPLASGSPRRTRGVVVATSLRGLLVRLWRPSSRRPTRRRQVVAPGFFVPRARLNGGDGGGMERGGESGDRGRIR